MATFRRIAALKGDASRWRGGARDRLARAAALSPHLSRTGSIRKEVNPILARRDEAERAKRAEERKKREAANTAAQNLAEMRGRLRFLQNMAAASPESASLARRVARLEYKIWKFTLAKTDVPKVIEAYQHALQYSENQTRPELWRDAAAAYISFVWRRMLPPPSALAGWSHACVAVLIDLGRTKAPTSCFVAWSWTFRCGKVCPRSCSHAPPSSDA